MFNKILLTFGTRLISATCNVIIVILTTQFLGAEGRGWISLIITTIVLVLMTSNFMGGSVLVYLIPRHLLFHLLFPAYVWAFITGIMAFVFLTVSELIPSQYVVHVIFLFLLHALFSIHLMIFIGKQEIKVHNFLTLLQVGIQLLFLLAFFVVCKKPSIIMFIYSLYLSYATGLIVSFLLLRKYIGAIDFNGILLAVKQCFKIGTVSQLGNLSQFLNYRLNYYFLNIFTTTAFVGIYSIGISLAESIWLISNSIAIVLYSKISNSNDITYSREITLKLTRLILLTIPAAILPLLLLPSELFVFIFGDEFHEVKKILLLLSPGIIATGVGVILSHYFGGTGKYYINTKSALAGLFVTLSLGMVLIPNYHIIGASIATSISYITNTGCLVYYFVKETKFPIREFIPSKKDFLFLINEFQMQISKK